MISASMFPSVSFCFIVPFLCSLRPLCDLHFSWHWWLWGILAGLDSCLTKFLTFCSWRVSVIPGCPL